MNGTSEQAFKMLLSSDGNAARLIQEIAKLDSELEQLRRGHTHPMLMSQKLCRIESLTFKAGELASKIDGGDPSEHAIWLSYNVQRLWRLYLDPARLIDPIRRLQSPSCLINFLFFAGSLLSFVIIMVRIFFSQ